VGRFGAASKITARKSPRRLNRGVYFSIFRLDIVPASHSMWNKGMHSAASFKDPDSLLTEVEAGQVLSLSTRTLQAWRVRRSGPAFVQAGRAVRYRRRDLCAWMDANTIRGGSISPPSAHAGEQSTWR
jgi:hypothetical protein